MIDTIIFDVGNVLAGFSWQAYLDRFHFDETAYDAVAKAMFQGDGLSEYDRSELSDDEILEMFIAKAPQYRKEITAVYENIGDTVQPFDYSMDWVRKLKEKGYKIYILSNFAARTYRMVEKRIPFIREADGGIFSFQVHAVKPEPEIYRALLDKYPITPGNAVFLDDLEENLEPARELGIHTIHFTSQIDAEIQLAKLGVA